MAGLPEIIAPGDTPSDLISVVGAPIGAVVNWRLVDRLGETAMTAYRMRRLANA